MSYFLSAQKLEKGSQVEISGDEARHILFSRRIKVGEKIVLQDPENNRFLAEVVSFTKKTIIAAVLEAVVAPKEPDLKITLFQSLISENALDYILQKSTELGISRVVLFNSRNTPTRLKEKVEGKKARWKKILQEAAKQSNRLLIPELEFFNDLSAALQAAKDLKPLFVFEKNAKQSLAEGKPNNYTNIGIVIGPEGGFTNDELTSLEELRNVVKAKLGPRVLRADTAAISAAAIIQSLWGDM